MLWAGSVALSVVLVAAVAVIWMDLARASIATTQLPDMGAVGKELDLESDDWDPVLIPTGVFVESLKFESATDVHITGYVWQRWTADIPDGIAEGFVLPEMVVSSEAVEEYRVPQDDHVLIGWSFEGTFRQPFEYGDYPFDHKTVRLRIWPRDFAADVVLVPDYGGYPATGVDDVFGIETSIVLGDWTRENTYFDYLEPVYNTDFGIDGYADQGETPELRFNVVLRRTFANPFIVNVVPLAIVAALAFGAVLTVTRDQERASVVGFNVSGVLATVSALFFVVLLAHSQLRQELPGAGLVYFEHLYFLMYVTLLLVAVSAHHASTMPRGSGTLDRYGENMLSKLAFWPLLLGAVLMVTLLAL